MCVYIDRQKYSTASNLIQSKRNFLNMEFSTAEGPSVAVHQLMSTLQHIVPHSHRNECYPAGGGT